MAASNGDVNGSAGSHGGPGGSRSPSPSPVSSARVNGAANSSPLMPSLSDISANATWGSTPRYSDELFFEDELEDVIREAVPETDWTGIGFSGLPMCACDRFCKLYRAWTGSHTGRCFFGCAAQVPRRRCQYVQWVDDEWPTPVARAFKKIWREMTAARVAVERAKEAVQYAVQVTEQAIDQKDTMEAEVRRTHRIAEKICLAYARKAMLATMDKNKFAYLCKCLILVVGLVFLMVAVLKR